MNSHFCIETARILARISYLIKNYNATLHLMQNIDLKPCSQSKPLFGVHLRQTRTCAIIPNYKITLDFKYIVQPRYQSSEFISRCKVYNKVDDSSLNNVAAKSLPCTA